MFGCRKILKSYLQSNNLLYNGKDDGSEEKIMDFERRKIDALLGIDKCYGK